MDGQNSNFDNLLSQYKVPLVLTLVGGVLLIGGLFSSGLISKTFIKATATSKETSQTIQKDLKIDISGSVRNPGVYNLTADARIEDGIKAAGGLTEEADLQHIQKNINLAQKLTDGAKLFIPKQGETVPVVLGTSQTLSSSLADSNSIININSASIKELDSLPGIGAVGAQKIIDNRPYSSLEELVSKKAITKGVYEKIKDLISIY